MSAAECPTPALDAEGLRREKLRSRTAAVCASVAVCTGGVASTLSVLWVTADPSLSDSVHTVRTAVAGGCERGGMA